MIHPDGKVDPSADMDTIETELIYADLEQAERRHARIVRDARGGDRALIAEEAWLREAIAALQAGRPVRSVPLPKEAPHAARDLGALTAKPVLYVANVDEGDDESPPSWPSTPRRARPARSRSPRGSRPSCRSSTTRRRRRCARSSVVSRTALPPVEVEELSLGDYHYRLPHGAHRYFASVAVGFTHIPARLRP